MSESQPNPYAAGVVSQDTVDTEVERTRKMHLSHEASVKSIWVVFLIAAFLCGIATVGLLTVPKSQAPMSQTVLQYAWAFVLAMFSAGYLFIGIALGRLSPWSRFPGLVLAAFGLLVIPIGTIISGYILYLLLSPKAAVVFSAEYKDIIRQTPHIKYKTTPVTWGCLGLILLAIALGIAAAFFN